MSELEERLNALISNPQLMQQIASMAQSMSGQSHGETQEHKEPAPVPAMDPKLLQTMAQTVSQTAADGNQQALLQALSPFVSGYRLQKLERAMQAAKLAGAASAFLSAGGLQMLTGR